MGKSPRTSQGRSIARRMESSGGRRKQKGDGLVPGSKHAGLFSDDAIASWQQLQLLPQSLLLFRACFTRREGGGMPAAPRD